MEGDFGGEDRVVRKLHDTGEVLAAEEVGGFFDGFDRQVGGKVVRIAVAGGNEGNVAVLSVAQKRPADWARDVVVDDIRFEGVKMLPNDVVGEGGNMEAVLVKEARELDGAVFLWERIDLVWVEEEAAGAEAQNAEPRDGFVVLNMRFAR